MKRISILIVDKDEGYVDNVIDDVQRLLQDALDELFSRWDYVIMVQDDQ